MFKSKIELNHDRETESGFVETPPLMTMTQYRAKFQPGDSLFFSLLHYFRFSQNVLQGLEA